MDPKVTVSYESLGKYLDGFHVSPDRLILPDPYQIPVEIRLARFALARDKHRFYFVGFIFDKVKKNRLLLLDSQCVEEVSHYLHAHGVASCNDVLIIIGKEGSRIRSQMSFAFRDVEKSKLILIDFDGKTPLKDFLVSVISNIEKVEARNRNLSDRVRLDLTSQPASDKRIKIFDEKKRGTVLFANQLMQITGISETIALGIAKQFETPFRLMNEISGSPISTELTFNSERGPRKVNSRVRSSLQRIFSLDARPYDTIR
jgi:hypothetical protein